MAKAKKGTPLGFNDSTGKGVVAGDFLRLEKHTVVQIYGDSVKVAGKKVLGKNLKELYPEFKVVSKIDDPVVVDSPEWEIGDIVSNGNVVGYFDSLTESKTAINLSCAWIKKNDTISTTWVISTKGLRRADPKELIEFLAELKRKGLVFDSETKSVLKTASVFAPGELVINSTEDVGCVRSSTPSDIEFAWLLTGASLRFNVKYTNSGYSRCTPERCINTLRMLNRLGYSLDDHYELVSILDGLFADKRVALMESLKNNSVKQVIDNYREQGLHGKITIQLEI